MADSNEPVKNLAPVKNRLPIDAEWKLKRELGRWRFWSSWFMWLKNDRSSSLFSEGIYGRNELVLGDRYWIVTL
jgi:hypothetical protein